MIKPLSWARPIDKYNVSILRALFLLSFIHCVSAEIPLIPIAAILTADQNHFSTFMLLDYIKTVDVTQYASTLNTLNPSGNDHKIINSMLGEACKSILCLILCYKFTTSSRLFCWKGVVLKLSLIRLLDD